MVHSEPTEYTTMQSDQQKEHLNESEKIYGFGNKSRRNMTDDQQNICIDIWCYLRKGYGNCAEYGARRHLFARQRMHSKTPWNDWFQSMHEMNGPTKRPIINIDNSKITHSPQMKTIANGWMPNFICTIWLVMHALIPCMRWNVQFSINLTIP